MSSNVCKLLRAIHKLNLVEFPALMVNVSSTCLILQVRCLTKPDRLAEHQYGYAGSQSRREAILQVEAWLDRLHAAGYSTVAALFDLTKAFDTLASSSIADIIQREQMPDAVHGLLLDLHRRLRISLKQADGTVLQVKLESGVLQGGGTGP